MNTRSPRPASTGAGDSARDMARQIAADGRRRRLALFAVVLLVVFAAAWGLSGSLRAALGLTLMAAAAAIIYASTRNDDAAKWRKGAAGERSTARMLRPLERRGYVILHDRGLGRETDRANIDHLVIGPCGPVVVDSKNWNRRTMIKHRGGRLWVGRTRGEKVIAGTAVERRRVATVLSEELRRPVDVHAVLAVHGAKLPYWRRPEIEGIPLLPARAVRRWIKHLPHQYDAAEVAQLAAIAERRFPPYTRPDF